MVAPRVRRPAGRGQSQWRLRGCSYRGSDVVSSWCLSGVTIASSSAGELVARLSRCKIEGENKTKQNFKRAWLALSYFEDVLVRSQADTCCAETRFEGHAKVYGRDGAIANAGPRVGSLQQILEGRCVEGVRCRKTRQKAKRARVVEVRIGMSSITLV